MSAAAIAAKVASAVLSSEKGRKTAGTVILVILVVLLTPVLAIAALLSNGISFDSSRLTEQVAAQMSAEQQARMEEIRSLGDLKGHTGRITCVVHNDDGTWISGSKDEVIRIWSEQTRQCVGLLRGSSVGALHYAKTQL